MFELANYYESMAAPYGRLSPDSKRIVRMRLELPYGVRTCADGTEVLYNRDYRPIWRRTPHGQIEAFHRSESIPWENQKWFYNDNNPPWEDRGTLRRCKKALDDFKRGRPLVGMRPTWAGYVKERWDSAPDGGTWHRPINRTLFGSRVYWLPAWLLSWNGFSSGHANGTDLPISTEEFKLRFGLPQRSFMEILEEGVRKVREGTAQQHPPQEPDRSRLSFSELLKAGAEAARNAVEQDPWEAPLRKLKGRIGHDGVERVSTNDAFDLLEVPMRRRPSETVRLSRVMRKLGWSNIRARGLNPGSYRDRVRGFAREVPGHPATMQRPNDF
jgi:hypothetical protein